MFAFRKHSKFANMIKEEYLLDKAIEYWELYTSIHPNIIREPTDIGVDATMSFEHNGKRQLIFIECKRELRNHQLPFIESLAQKHHPLMVIADKIFPSIKDALREIGVSYLESNGNMYYRDKNLLILVEGQKPVKIEQEKNGRAFTRTGLKVVFHFLIEQELVNAPYRLIAERTGVSFGNINFVMSDLKQKGYLIKVNNDQLKLTKKSDLLDKWMDAYENKLKPSLLIGKFKFMNEAAALKWREMQLNQYKSWWGGEPAGAILTNFLQPEIFTIYTVESKGELMKTYRLLPDVNGNINIYKKFWQDVATHNNAVPPLLAYVDLMITGNRRCMETAKKIYDEFLQHKF